MKEGPKNLAEQVIKLVETHLYPKLAQIDAYHNQDRMNGVDQCQYCKYPIGYPVPRCYICRKGLYCAKPWCKPTKPTCSICKTESSICKDCAANTCCDEDCSQTFCETCIGIAKCQSCDQFFCMSKLRRLKITIGELVMYSRPNLCDSCRYLCQNADKTNLHGCMTCFQNFIDLFSVNRSLAPVCEHQADGMGTPNNP